MDPLSAISQIVSTCKWIILKLEEAKDLDKELQELLVLVDRVRRLLECGDIRQAVSSSQMAAQGALEGMVQAMHNLNRVIVKVESKGMLSKFLTAGKQRIKLQDCVVQLNTSMTLLTTELTSRTVVLAEGTLREMRALPQALQMYVHQLHEAIAAVQRALDEQAKKLSTVRQNVHGAKEEIGGKVDRMQKMIEDLALQMSESKQAQQPQAAKAAPTGRAYTHDELKAATKDFSHKIGEGGFGPVYSGVLHGVPVAVKVMATGPDAMQGPKEFQAEVDILSKLHHPHIIMLLGSCPEKGMLVYELAEGGCLEDRLLNASRDRLPLPWQHRVNIALQVASGLLHMHSAPERIVHMDLNPRNIILSKHGDAKLGDVGLSRLMVNHLPPAASVALSITRCSVVDTALVGTFAYIDPEYQRYGTFSHQSDVYALGVVMLQLLTGLEALRVVATVEAARERAGGFAKVLDKAAGAWPLENAEAFADIALKCAEFRRKDRPDLRLHVLPELQKLQAPLPVAALLAAAHELQAATGARTCTDEDMPSYFLCPISQDIMRDPVMAADGHMYDRAMIEAWLSENNTSPMTNAPLVHKVLTPVFALRSAIQDYLVKHPKQAVEPLPTDAQRQRHRQGQQATPVLSAAAQEWQRRLATMTTLTLPNGGLKFDQAFAEALATNTTLQQLDLSSNILHDKGCKALAAALATNTALQQLNLKCNLIAIEGCYEGWKALAVALATNTTLRELDLSNNSIGDEGCIALAAALATNATLQKLNLEGNSIGAEGCKALAAALATNTVLQQLDLSHNSIGDELRCDECCKALAALATNTTLRHLDLRGNIIGDEGCKALTAALATNTKTTLQQLNLNGNRIGAKGCKALAAALATNATLQQLDLSNNSIGDEGCIALAAALAMNTRMRQLNLSCNSIRAEGCKALGVALATNASLQKLNLKANMINDEGCKALAAALATNATLQQLELGAVSIDKNSIGDEGCKALAAALATNTTLQQLDLSNNSIGDEGCKALGVALATNTNTTLQQLDLSNNSIGDEGCKALGVALATNTNTTLQQLELYYNSIGDEGCKALGVALATNTTLQQLELYRNSIGDEGCKALGVALATNTTLQQLNLSSNNIGAEGCKALVAALATNTALQQLGLCNISIGDEGCKALAAALATNTNTTLQQLSLVSNGIGAKGCKALAAALATNTSLRHLIFQCNSIGGKGCKALAQALATNTTLQQLNLWDTNIGDEGCNALAAALATNIKLQQLILNENSIGDEGCKALAAALATNTTLQQLHLGWNTSIGDEGCKALAAALATNTTLQQLELYWSSISDEGCKALVTVNPGLQIKGLWGIRSR